MFDLPPILPEKGKTRAQNRWLNRRRACVRALYPMQSLNVLTGMTHAGVSRQGMPVAKLPAQEPGAIGEIRQWESGTAYTKDDLAFCDTTDERNDGAQAGLYQALEDVTGGAHPSVSASWVLVARAYWQKLKLRYDTRTILLDCTAFQGVTLDGPKLELWDGVDEERKATLYLADIPVGAGPVKFRDWTVCVGGVNKVATFLSGPPREIT